MSIKSLIKSTGIYFIGNVLSKIIIFFLLPIYTSYIPPESMGIYDTGVTVITLFASALFLDIGSVILKFTLEKENDNISSPITNGTIIFFSSCVLYLIVLIVGSMFFKFPYFEWIILYGFIYALNNMVGYVARALHYNTDYAIAGVIQTLLMVILNIVMLIGLKMDYRSLYISFSLSSFIATIYMLWKAHIYKYLKKVSFDREKFVQMLKFALPLCVNSMAFWLLSSSGRVIVTYVLGADATGYLSVANKFNQIIYLVSTCVHMTWQETAFAHDNARENEGGFYSNTFSVYYRVVLYCIALLIPAIRLGLFVFPEFIDSSYSSSINLIPTALIGTGLAIISQFLGTIFSSIKKTTIVFLSTLAGAITTVTTTFLFIYLGFGPESANYSFILGYLAAIVMRILLLKKHIGFRFRIRNLLYLIPILLVTIYVYINYTHIYNIIMLVILLLASPLFFAKELKGLRGKIKL